ncbi:MAG: beta-galactosidase [Lachnospiraceae bacterium]|nr:beta-galactosidase [Lachnospiraceae bacterium]
MRKEQNFKWDKLSLGVCYYPEHWDRSLWQDDLRRMKENGICTVRVAEFAWSIFEPEEGVFSFELFDAFLDLAEQEGMKVIFGTPTAIPPVWLTEKYPEVLNCRKDGVLFRHGMRRHFNYNSKTLHRLASGVVQQVAAHYAKRPCIVGWQIDNELNCEIMEFYSESDTLAFREFLQEKYGTLDELNEAWGTVFWNQTYSDWNQVYVPRPTINDMTNPHQMLDFTRFISESAIRFCKMQSDILREHVKAGDFITTNGMFGNLDNHRMADTCLDVCTYDSYPNFAYCMNENPKNNRTLNDRKWSRNLTEVRSVCPHFGIMEQQSGANGWNTNGEAPAPKPGQMMLWAMQSIMHGADYVSFFRWRTATKGTEIYWHGILDYDNCDNRKMQEVKKIDKRVQAIGDVAGAEYVAALGLVRDYDNIFDAQQDVWHGRVAEKSEMEIFVASQLHHTPMDAVYMREDTDAEELKKYKVLFYPHAEILTEKACQVLEAYVRQGGCLIIGARTGQKDSNGQCVMKRMPGLLSPVTQSAVKEFTLIGPDDDAVTMNWNGKEVETGVFNDILETAGTDAKVLATYSGSYYKGSPALIETKVGDGKILHFGGTFTRNNVRDFLAYAGILEPFAELVHAPQECELAVRRKENKEYLFVLNFSKEGQKIRLQREMTDMDSGEKVKGDVALAPYETKVYI